MSLCVSSHADYGWSAAADHHLCKYRLFDAPSGGVRRPCSELADDAESGLIS